MAPLPAPLTGCHGKLPSLGDFSTRHLPPSFVRPWDHWLQRALRASQAALGSAWMDHFLASPFWRFALAPGVCDHQGWVGVLMPSVDRVGRAFPLTLARPLPPHAGVLGATLHAQGWYAAAEELLLACLHPQLDLAVLDDRLAALPWPSHWPAALAGPPWQLPAAAGAAQPGLPNSPNLPPDWTPLLDALASVTPTPWSCWSTTGSARVAAGLQLCAGLPAERRFAAMLAG